MRAAERLRWSSGTSMCYAGETTRACSVHVWCEQLQKLAMDGRACGDGRDVLDLEVPHGEDGLASPRREPQPGFLRDQAGGGEVPESALLLHVAVQSSCGAVTELHDGAPERADASAPAL